MLESTENELQMTTESKIPWGPLASLGAAFGILFLGFWFALSFTEGAGKPKGEQEVKSEIADSTQLGSRRANQLKSAFAARQRLLEMDEEIQKKHGRNSRQSTRYSTKDRESAYRAWRKQKEQTERFYSKFKDDDSTDPNSVKVQMQKTLEQLESDRPRR